MAKKDSHEDKMINLTRQMQHNNVELQSFLKDLDSWEKDIKVKEDKLKSNDDAVKDVKKVSDIPPVRNTIHKKKLKKKKKEKPAPDPSKPKKISGFDFRAWDKFDVDKALEEIDGDEEKKKDTSSSEYETDEEWEMERKKYLAVQEKEKGNDLLKKGDIDFAIEAYSRGMEFDPANPILPANRAMALLKQQKYAAAEFDCTTAISLDPLYVKAYLRRGSARAGKGELHQAREDFSRALELEPSNKQAKAEVERIDKELGRSKDETVKSSLMSLADTSQQNLGRVQPIYKQPEDRSKKPLHRVTIEEIGLTAAPRPAPAAQSLTAQALAQRGEKEFDKLLTSSGPSTPPVQEKTPAKITPIENGDLDQSLKKDSGLSSSGMLSKSPVSSASSGSKSVDSSMAKKSLVAKELPTDRAVSEKEFGQGDSCSKGLPGIPQSSPQFQADMKLLKQNPEALREYFKAIPVASYQKLFGLGIEADTLTSILQGLNTSPDSVDLYSILQNLSKVKRFSMTAMFLSKKEKQVASNLMDHLGSADNCTQEQITSLKKAYGL